MYRRRSSAFRSAVECFLRSAPAQNACFSTPSLLSDQLDRMESSVTHQLSRAAVTGPVVVGRSVNLATVVARLVRALKTAYADRGIEVTEAVPENLTVRGDERDLMEMLGNVLENAFKYTSTRIRIGADRNSVISVWVEDDGPGIAPELREEVLNRGSRADEVRPGQGIGLSVVAELVALYQGELLIETGSLGGARVCLDLPA